MNIIVAPMIDRNSLPIDAPSMVLGAACDATISALLAVHRNIDKFKFTEAYQIQNMLQDMIIELEEIKENGE